MSRRAVTEAPTERMCKGGCSEVALPIERFYSRGVSASGVKLYDHLCKVCTCAAEKIRYARRPLRPKREKHDSRTTCRELSGYDLIPCELCGLRGHRPGDPEKCASAHGERSTGMGARGEEWAL